MAALKTLLLQMSERAMEDAGYPTFVAALVAGLFLVLAVNIHAAIQAMPEAPGQEVYPLHN